jgi:poly [ADP-ribose] polymerase 10/14/15
MVESRKHGNDANEKRLFHGTERDTIPKINRNSFNRSFCGKNATVYGKGVYFAVDASYSIDETYSRPDSQGNKYMYLARVVVGDFCVGNNTMRMPPPQHDEDASPASQAYSSSPSAVVDTRHSEENSFRQSIRRSQFSYIGAS